MPVAEDDPRLPRCGFAKLQGEGIEVYVRKYTIYLGRKSKSTSLDVVLGEHRNISRKHACIRYNFQKGSFELVVLGKNGVTVTSGMRGILHTPASPPTELRSQDMIQMGDKTFYFLLPKDASRLGPSAPKQRRLCNRQSSRGEDVAPLQTNGQPEYFFTPCMSPNKPLAEMEESKDVSGKVDCYQQGTDFSQASDPRVEGYRWHNQVSQISPELVEGARQKRKLSELNSDPQDLVYPHTTALEVRGAQLYHSGGVA